MSLIKKYIRPLLSYGLVLFFLMAGAIIMEMENGSFEAMGSVFLSFSAAIFVYTPIHWLVRKLFFERSPGRWLKVETWILAIALAFAFAIGMAESFEGHPFLTFVFSQASAFILLVRYKAFFREPVPTRRSMLGDWGTRRLFFWSVGLGSTILLLVLTAYEYEPWVNMMATFYALIVFGLSIRWLFRQIRNIINLRKEKAQTELLHLKSQVNPHFFFNMLNNLYGIVEHEPQKAQALILKLSDMMRYSIYEGEKNHVSLQQEVDYLRNYIELHRMRYHKTIDVSFQENIEEGSQQVMPLLFIILLENAFKHGVENLRKDAFVNINMVADDQTVNFTVENNFDHLLEGEEPGIGLKNLQRRLELAYPGRHSYSFLNSNGVYTANLSLRLP
jgi:two-component system sensor histidine kinase AlgZ